jgi:mRNA-degrading endonuclease RelE of RelBE toxin-antitoxin system
MILKKIVTKMINDKIKMDLQWKKQAKKYVQKQDAPTQKRLKQAVLPLKSYPFENHEQIEQIQGSDDWGRIRIGKFRILFSTNIEKRIVIIQTVDSRGDAYKRH